MNVYIDILLLEVIFVMYFPFESISCEYSRQQVPVDAAAVGNQKRFDKRWGETSTDTGGPWQGGTHACEGKTSINAHQTYLDHGSYSWVSQIATVIGIGVVASAGARFVGRKVIVALVVLILAV